MREEEVDENGLVESGLEPHHAAFEAAMKAAITEHGASLSKSDVISLLAYLIGLFVGWNVKPHAHDQIMTMVNANIDIGLKEGKRLGILEDMDVEGTA